MIEKASIYTMNALNKSSELWHTSVNRKARPVVEGEHDKSWNDHGSGPQNLGVPTALRALKSTGEKSDVLKF